MGTFCWPHIYHISAPASISFLMASYSHKMACLLSILGDWKHKATLLLCQPKLNLWKPWQHKSFHKRPDQHLTQAQCDQCCAHNRLPWIWSREHWNWALKPRDRLFQRAAGIFMLYSSLIVNPPLFILSFVNELVSKKISLWVSILQALSKSDKWEFRQEYWWVLELWLHKNDG